VEMHAMGDHLGVGFRCEGIAGPGQLVAQLFVIFNDAVVNDRESAQRDVRMGVAFGRDAV
jgi:hypothetical protein